jgi:hypothetical protein
MDVKLSVELPPEAEKRLRAENPDLPAAVREGFLVNLFQRGILTHSELGKALGLDPLKTDTLLQRHMVTGQAMTHEEADTDLGGNVRPERARVPSRTFTLGPESEAELFEETLLAWQSQGPAAAWQAMFDMLGLWFEARGLDPETQAVDRTSIEVHRVPWHRSPADCGADA